MLLVSCGSCGVVLRDGGGDFVSQVFCRDPEQKEQDHNDRRAAGEGPSGGH